MNKLLIATHNPGKLDEIKKSIKSSTIDLVSLSDIGVTEDVDEDGQTYEENSQKKALHYAKLTGIPSLSDDGGLEIDALNGEPGIRSRRWLGHHASDQELMDHLSLVSKKLPQSNRRAKFVTVISFATPLGEVFSAKGEVSGVIAKRPLAHTTNGLPYRSYFFIPEIKKFYYESEMTSLENEKYNHRIRAINKILPQIFKSLDLEAK